MLNSYIRNGSFHTAVYCEAVSSPYNSLNSAIIFVLTLLEIVKGGGGGGELTVQA